MIQLASPFQDHAILQRDKPLTVWGWGPPNAAISISLGQASAQTTIAADGTWQVQLAPQPAGGPHTLDVVSGSQTITLNDILLGDLWLASGQSNMQMLLRDCRDAAAEIAAANYPSIRLLTTSRVIAMQPQETVGGAWQVCTPDFAGEFSGTAYFFARHLHRQLNIPIGIIDSSWGGTIAEAWTSREGLLVEPANRHFIEKLDYMLAPGPNSTKEEFEKEQQQWRDKLPKDSGNAGFDNSWHLPAFDDSQWNSLKLPLSWQHAGHNISGVFWFRHQVEIPAAWAGQTLELSIGACDKRDYTYFNGHLCGSFGMEDDPNAWNTPRRYTIPATQLQSGIQTIAVRVFSEIYQGGMIGPAREMWLAPVGADPSQRLSLAGDWRYAIEQDYGYVDIPPPPAPYGPGNANSPTALFNSMIAPYLPLALTGFIWYQGESNTARYDGYHTTFSNLIRDWRRLFGQGDLPFYFVQLANYMATSTQPLHSSWAELREAQRRTLALPHTGMAVAIDIGEANDIHPKNKQDIGLRLALAALQHTYQIPNTHGTSPQPHRAWRDGDRVIIQFRDTAGGLQLTSDTQPLGFALAEQNRKYRWAEAKLIAPDQVELHTPPLSDPLWVRYAWANNPVTNLVGGTGLPASPFEIPLPF